MLAKQKSLKDISVNEKVDHYLLLNKIEIKLTKTNKEYLDLEFRDKSSFIVGRMWDNIDTIKNITKEGDIVKVYGTIEKYQEQLQIKVDKIKLTLVKDNISIEDFLPRSERDFDEMIKELDNLIDSLKNEYLRNLTKSLLKGKNLENFLRMPAGKSWHHAYIHGLLEHTLEVAKLCDVMHSFHPDLNRDLMITGALLHDYGKVFELQYKPTFDYTDKGKLMGHIVIVSIEIEKATEKIPNFPEELKNQIQHLVLSHQGKLEQASPVEPKMAEAIALYYADELSAKTNAYKNIIKEYNKEKGGWTNFVKLANTYFYISPKETNGDYKESLFEE
ncbi:MAG: HD domain-containing protein [Ignavibacteriales bacterium]|nr:HD domain-containing protein [Ignavibacteriales bacterium]